VLRYEAGAASNKAQRGRHSPASVQGARGQSNADIPAKPESARAHSQALSSTTVSFLSTYHQGRRRQLLNPPGNMKGLQLIARSPSGALYVPDVSYARRNLRRAAPAKPRMPVPRSTKLLGSGVVATGPLLLSLPSVDDASPVCAGPSVSALCR
jgi:hypothetical protein